MAEGKKLFVFYNANKYVDIVCINILKSSVLFKGVIIDLETPDGTSIRSASPAPQSANFSDRFWVCNH